MNNNRNKQEFYKCFSPPQRRFIETHSIYPISSGVHPKTNRVYYVFEMTSELSKILTTWSNNNPNRKRR